MFFGKLDFLSKKLDSFLENLISNLELWGTRKIWTLAIGCIFENEIRNPVTGFDSTKSRKRTTPARRNFAKGGKQTQRLGLYSQNDWIAPTHIGRNFAKGGKQTQ